MSLIQSQNKVWAVQLGVMSCRINAEASARHDD
jgi:hypothetical protein